MGIHYSHICGSFEFTTKYIYYECSIQNLYYTSNGCGILVNTQWYISRHNIIFIQSLEMSVFYSNTNARCEMCNSKHLTYIQYVFRYEKVYYFVVWRILKHTGLGLISNAKFQSSCQLALEFFFNLKKKNDFLQSSVCFLLYIFIQC